MIDRGFKRLETQSTYYQRLSDWYGAEAIVQCRTHAKFALIVADGWSIAVRTSANLNRNVRLEQFSLDDDPDMVAFYAGIVSSWAGCVAAGFGPAVRDVDRAFLSSRALADVASEPPIAAPDAVEFGDLDFEDIDLPDFDLGVD